MRKLKKERIDLDEIKIEIERLRQEGSKIRRYRSELMFQYENKLRKLQRIKESD